MANDRSEATRRGRPARKASKNHPYAAIEHRVIDSKAYADLSFSARALLVQLARQLTVPNNNGRLQATHSYLADYGFSENTISRGIAELIAHGILYRTRYGGYQQGAALYAVTWLSLTDNREGLSCNAFKPCAWRDWTPEQEKSRPPKLRTYNRKFGDLTPDTVANLATDLPPKKENYELVPVVHSAIGAQPSTKNSTHEDFSSQRRIEPIISSDYATLRQVAA